MSKTMNNYIKLFLIVIVVVILSLLVSNIYRNIVNNRKNVSYIDSYVNKGTYSDIKSILPELSTNEFLYLSYVGDRDIYNFEKNLTKMLKKNDLLDSFIYIDLSDELNDLNGVDDLNKQLNIITDKDIILPAIIYYRDGKPTDYIDSSIEKISVGKVEQLLEKWEIIND